jgi:hypothetical protein
MIARTDRRRVLALGLLVSMLASPSLAHATPLETCRRVIDRNGDWLVHRVDAVESACFAERAAGLLPPDTRCIGEGDRNDQVGDPATQAKIDRAIREATDQIAQKCTEDQLLFLPPKGLGLSATPGSTDVIPSLIAAHLAASQSIMHARYPNEAPVTTCTGLVLLVTLVDEMHLGVGGVEVALGYPDGVSIPGSGNDASVYAHVQILGTNGLAVANDQDDLGSGNDRILLGEVSQGDIAGPFARVAFCVDAGPAPPLDAFTCSVQSASTPDGTPIDPAFVACTLAVVE